MYFRCKVRSLFHSAKLMASDDMKSCISRLTGIIFQLWRETDNSFLKRAVHGRSFQKVRVKRERTLEDETMVRQDLY